MRPHQIITITTLTDLQARLMEWAIATSLTIPDIPGWKDTSSRNNPTQLFHGIQRHLSRLGAKKSARIYLLGDRLTEVELWIFHQLLESIEVQNHGGDRQVRKNNYQQLEVA